MAMPLMPMGADQVATSMPGQSPMGPTGPGPGGDLASLLGLGGNPSMGGIDPLQGALGQFDMLAQQIADLARVFPGSEQVASQMMELIDQWRQNVLVMATPQPSSMPGADAMM